MRLDDYIDNLKPDDEHRRRRLAEEKSYEVMDYVDEVADRFKFATQDTDTVFGSTSPSIFVGRSHYPNVATGILTPVGAEEQAASFETSSRWYAQNLDIHHILQRRAGMLNSNRRTDVDVYDAWDGFLGVQREVAIADQPVDVEIGLSDQPDLDLTMDDITTPTGPRAPAEEAMLTENPHVPRVVDKAVSDDDWRAEGAMAFLYRRGYDVYEINSILSAGALGQDTNRRLVPTRWSITAVDDTIGQYLRGQIRNAASIDKVQVWVNEYVGNRYWIILAPGQWEYEFVEMKSPGSVWNPAPAGDVWIASAREDYQGRSDYVDETAGAYYAARVGVLEHLADIDRQAKVLILREVSDEYWAPVGVWQIRESVRNAFDGVHGEAETLREAVDAILPELPVSLTALRRKSLSVSGLQSTLSEFTTNG